MWRHTAALARATGEVRRVCADFTTPTLDEVAQLDYTDACISETLRPKPAAPQNGMQALRDTSLGDLHIPAAMDVIGVMRRDATSERHVPGAAVCEPSWWLARWR